MPYPEAVWERAMKVQEDHEGPDRGTALASAADILAFSPRTLRRWRARYEPFGYEGQSDPAMSSCLG